ncbi:hypothetical protein MGG_07598 [Pyricularia oryzae 70-15]|uniref:Infection structure specific protein n=3 Tax=Pyricularia oryzae TaxID=318829 RepID=G4N2J9_PYRO7|nr:uncharacterized protein MGG_07598 [Pyricularia oryzae 70-15]EHA51708.1 hypothetical protein MGG_07598 [Pyricularia oryzae 70-15]ELQ40507.1 hypothetical protein OOU_Y34scaffold00429g2 [Pyricularia oryzae Y34]KAI7911852.1 hypothetical protein M9X92_010331 [Pyricularia oryzae]KAI7912903.1 hypothetical protein M0657_010263 [Pyricularia oryzae]
MKSNVILMALPATVLAVNLEPRQTFHTALPAWPPTGTQAFETACSSALNIIETSQPQLPSELKSIISAASAGTDLCKARTQTPVIPESLSSTYVAVLDQQRAWSTAADNKILISSASQVCSEAKASSLASFQAIDRSCVAASATSVPSAATTGGVPVISARSTGSITTSAVPIATAGAGRREVGSILVVGAVLLAGMLM